MFCSSALPADSWYTFVLQQKPKTTNHKKTHQFFRRKQTHDSPDRSGSEVKISEGRIFHAAPWDFDLAFNFACMPRASLRAWRRLRRRWSWCFLPPPWGVCVCVGGGKGGEVGMGVGGGCGCLAARRRAIFSPLPGCVRGGRSTSRAFHTLHASLVLSCGASPCVAARVVCVAATGVGERIMTGDFSLPEISLEPEECLYLVRGYTFFVWFQNCLGVASI